MTADAPMSEPVPEGATERLKLTLAERHRVRDLEAEVARLRGVVARVEALHVRVVGVGVGGWCSDDDFTWPCPTVRALTTPQPDGGA